MTEYDELEIDLRDLLFYLLKHWRSFVLGILLCGGAAGLFGYLSVTKSNDYLAKQSEEVLAYERELRAYEDDLTEYETRIQSCEAQWQDQADYLEDSPLMRINPWQKPLAKAVFYVQAEDGGSLFNSSALIQDPADSLVAAYASAAADQLDWSALAEAGILGDLPEEYIRELVQSEADYESNTLTVSVTAPDEAAAARMLSELIRQLQAQSTDFRQLLGAHTLSVLTESTSLTVDQDLWDRQQSAYDRSATLRTLITQASDSLNKLEEPQKPTSAMANYPFLNGGKYGAIGAVCGVVLVGMLWRMIYILGGRLHTEGDITTALRLPVLTVLERVDAKTPATGAEGPQALYRFPQNSGKNPEQSPLAWLGANLCLSLCGKETADATGHLLVTGSLDSSRLSGFADALAPHLGGWTVEAGAGLSQDAETIKLLDRADAVLLLEERGVSRLTAIREEKEIIDRMGKEIAGVVLL